MLYESSKPMPYVYLCVHRETNQFYIGSRTASTVRLPSNQDIVTYRTSSKTVRPIFDQFDVTIIAEFFDARDALTFEQQLIYQHWGDPLLLNKSCHINHSVHWSAAGLKRTDETKQKLSKRASIRRWSDAHKAKISDTQKGKSKPCKRTEKFFWFNDGINNQLFSEHDLIPDSFVRGRLMPQNKQNSNNKGKTWTLVEGRRVYSS